MKHLAAPTLAGAALLLAACGAQPQAQTHEAPPAEVAVQTVRTQPAQLSITLPGRTVAYRAAEVRPQVSGIIQERLFQEGAEVKAGQPLYQIDAAPYKAAYESAEAALKRAEALVAAAENREKRFANLSKLSAVSKQDHDDAVASAKQARADVAAARATRDNAKINLDRTTIVAPIAGRIGRTYVTAGALVTASQAQKLTDINALDPIYVDLTQSSAEILRLKQRLRSGQLETTNGDHLGVSLTLEDGSVYEHKGDLELTEVSVDPSTGSVLLRAVFPNPDNLLLPGMFVRAELIEGELENAILIPQKAVTRNSQGDGVVYVVQNDNNTEQRPIETGRAIGDQWLVTAGLKPGERIVVEGFQRIRPGVPIVPVDTARIAEKQADQKAGSHGASSASGIR